MAFSTHTTSFQVLRKAEQCEVAKLVANAKPTFLERPFTAFSTYTTSFQVLRKAEQCEVAKLVANAKPISSE